MPNHLGTLEALERRAAPGPWEEHESPEEGFWVESANGGLVSTDTGLHIWPREADINVALAARNALPALLRVARAAMDTLAEAEKNYVDAGRDGETDAYCTTVSLPELRAALAALDAAGEGE